MTDVSAVRGRVYMADIGPGPKPWLVVSNNRRNRQLDTCLAVRITTSAKPPIPSIVELDHQDPLVGRVLCDDIAQLYHDELDQDRGAVSSRTIAAVNDALRVALALP